MIDAQTWPGQRSNGLLTGKVAVITGAARGIGRSIAVDIAANGADIVGIDIDATVSPIVQYQAATPDGLEKTGKLIRSHGRNFMAISADIRQIATLKQAATQAEQSMGKIDIVVANAAIQAFAGDGRCRLARCHRQQPERYSQHRPSLCAAPGQARQAS